VVEGGRAHASGTGEGMLSGVLPKSSRKTVACAPRAGDVLLMRPLLVHASSAASQATHRRVVHIDYASTLLDGGLRWLTHPQSEDEY
jgi:hypothetical protein